MLIARIPRVLSFTFRSLTWDIPADEKVVYLTFDDGPTPDVTSRVLSVLKDYNCKATFFCLGKNVEAHPEIYRQILDQGHGVGNHSYSHVKGFRMGLSSYEKNVGKAAAIIDSSLFRPPYGRILPGQVRRLRNTYRIIMWSVLSVDYNRNISGSQVVKNVTRNVKPGSIIVFHDSVKASENLYYALPKVLEFLRSNGYKTGLIADGILTASESGG